jgi:hypothetical protein
LQVRVLPALSLCSTQKGASSRCFGTAVRPSDLPPLSGRIRPNRGATGAQTGARRDRDPNVKNAHIVPQTYLRNWTIDDKIAVWLVPEGKRLPDQSVENVGTRRRFYRRTRPSSGEEIDDVEAMLGQGEAAATPLLRSFAQKWPLPTNEKIQLAELFGYQFLRGPRWKAE